MNKIVLFFFMIFLSQNVCSQINVADYLRNKTLSEFVAKCNSDEERALRLLYQFEISDSIDYKCNEYVWYSDFALELDLPRSSGSITPNYYASLKIKAYSWIIRIFKKDYDECGESLYDFGYYDYKRYSENNKLPITISKNNDVFWGKIRKDLKKWYEKLNRFDLEYLRQKGQPPICPNDYRLRSDIGSMFQFKYNSENAKCDKLIDVTYYLKNKTLSEFVAYCDSNEMLALKKLYLFELPEVCPDTLMWYSEKDRFKIYHDHKDSNRLQKYASLKLKAYSWIIRIWLEQYDECPVYYDFEFYDYKMNRDGTLEAIKNDEIGGKSIAIKKSIYRWINIAEKRGIMYTRFNTKAPFRILDYSIFPKCD